MKIAKHLANSKSLLEFMLDNIANGVIVLDALGTVVAVNNSCKNFLPAHFNTLLGQSFTQLLAATDAEKFAKYMQATLVSSANKPLALPLVMAIAQPYCSVTLLAITRCQLEQQQYVILSIALSHLDSVGVTDVDTERKIKSAISDSSLDTLITINMDDIIVDYNETGYKMFGWKREEVLGRRMYELFVPPELHAAHKHGLEHYKNTREGPLLGKRVVIEAMHRDGHRIPVELSLVPIDLKDQHYVTAFLRDISELKQSEQALKAESEKAQAASAAKSRFLSHMSHEIRSPLNSLLGGVELLGDILNSKEQDYFYKLVQSSGESLLAIINEILDFSKIESGHVELHREMTSIDDLVEQALQTAIINCPEQVYLFGSIAPTTPALIELDASKIRQVMIIFLDNAMKFTQHGMISLNLAYFTSAAGEATEGTLQIKVSDTGVGIDKHEQNKIFAEFEQVDAIRDSSFGGTGLGLTIAKRLIELMGGSIKLQSSKACGTRFIIEIPCKNQSLPLTTQPLPEVIAVMGPDPALHTFVSNTVLAHANNPVQTLYYEHQQPLAAWLTEHQVNYLICNDSHYQQYQLADTLADSIPVVVIATSHLSTPNFSNKQLALIQAPTTSRKLINALIAANSNTTASQHPQVSNANTAQAATTAKTNKVNSDTHSSAANNIHVLVVDDMMSNRLVAKAMLTKVGFEVDEAQNGLEALDKVAAKHFDIVLMDMRMPKLDGLGATIRIRESNAPYANIPIIALTANAEESERERCLSAGINAFISKPFKLSLLIAEINRQLMLKASKE
ncbi:response regulator [Pseudoalteromonas sp.]|uniref:response regulator n=1 Tax=Pseudoalteromonas sp. TaxID=53249 RepID=UPI0035690447